MPNKLIEDRIRLIIEMIVLEGTPIGDFSLTDIEKENIDNAVIKLSTLVASERKDAYEKGVNTLYHRIDCDTLISELYGWRNILDMAKDEALNLNGKEYLKDLKEKEQK